MHPLGDGALRFARPPGVDARVLLERLRAWPRVRDVVVTEEHVGVYFDPRNPPEDPSKSLAAGNARPPEGQIQRLVVRVRYDGADLEAICAHAELSIDAVAALHAGADYVVTMVGFLPGFAYLRGVDARLVLPRRPAPRPRVPAGAVGIAAGYTGIYPCASPGGWNLVGTAVDFHAFTPDRGATLEVGDHVRFERVQ
jgi:UPF0271 protein